VNDFNHQQIVSILQEIDFT